MKKLWPWVIGIFVFLLMIAAIAAVMRLFSFGPSSMAIGREANPILRDGIWYHHGRGMHWGFQRLPFLGFFGMIFALLLPLGAAALLVLGIILIVRKITTPNKKSNEAVVSLCHQCGKPVEDDWVLCPYCGEKLGGE